MFRSLRKFCLIGAPMWVVACTGSIGERGRGAGEPGGPSGPATPGVGKPNVPGSPGEEPPGGSLEPASTISGSSKCVSGKPGPRLLRRLTAEQLDNSVRDLFRNPGAPQSNIFNDPQVLG